jgi:hypothetical protein
MGNMTRSSLHRFRFIVLTLIIAASFVFSAPVHANKVFVENDVIIVGKAFVNTIPFNEGVVVASSRGKFRPVTFLGAEGTAAMLFLYNRVTRDMGVDLVVKTYKGQIDRKSAADAVDRVIGFYRDRDLVYKSCRVVEPDENFGLMRFRI